MPEQPREVIYRPAKVAGLEWPRWDRTNAFYLVTQGEDVVYVYFGSYYTAGEVVSDVIARNEHDRTSLTGEWSSMDFVVWHEERIMVVVHQRFDDEAGGFRVVRFDEPGNIPDDYFEPFYCFPTRDEWIAGGCGPVGPSRIEADTDATTPEAESMLESPTPGSPDSDPADDMMYDDHILASAYRSDTEPWRIARLQRVIGYVCAIGGARLLLKVDSLNDHKGTLKVRWNADPTEVEKGFFATAWGSVIGDGSEDVEHERD